jgi:3-phenylpropionate/trans-cinnamate dioxygenase ferredoxin reductase subunit
MSVRGLEPAAQAAIRRLGRFPGTPAGVLHRLESVQNATDQGRHVARAILGDTRAYGEVPWFWSIQGPVRLQIAGLSRPDDTTVTAGDPAAGRFSVFCFRSGRLVAVESVNRPADHVAARRVLATDQLPTPEQTTAPGFSLKKYVTDLATTH